MKARFKTILLSAMSVIAAFSAVTYTSCNNDKCKAIVCAHDGVCKDGDCICKPGYEGTQCEVITRDKYKGVWNVFEKGTYTDATQYVISIDYTNDMTRMTINGFYNNLNTPVTMNINGDNITIPQQTVEHYVIQGTGSLTYTDHYAKHGTLTVKYTIMDTDNGKTNDFGVNPGSKPSVWSR
ncbi:MAG: calcium-binding EGF-like domain-containing protein [Bacteroidetes bacterium]|nr:calcium-binding EGF-like domain-containing protein [Bacteroidota bacterium]